MEVMLKAISPIYFVLRQQQKIYSISAFLPKMMKSMAEIRGNLSDNTIQKKSAECIGKKSMQDLCILSMIHLCWQVRAEVINCSIHVVVSCITSY